MPVLLNARHERVAQFLAQGKTATEAYKLAGYKPNRHNAATLARNTAIRQRVAQINTETAKMASVTAESLIEQAEAVRVSAMQSGQCSAAVAAIKEKGVLSGHRIERREIGGPGEFDSMTNDELKRALFERIKALGLMPDIGRDTRH